MRLVQIVAPIFFEAGPAAGHHFLTRLVLSHANSQASCPATQGRLGLPRKQYCVLDFFPSPGCLGCGEYPSDSASRPVESKPMFATFLMIVTCIVISLQALPSADDDSPQSRIKSLAVTFSPGDPSSPLAPRFSPKGTQLPLVPKDYRELKGTDHLETRVGIGPDGTREPGQLLVLARSSPGKPYDLLYIDSNRDQKLSEEPIRTTPSITRGKIWSSFSGTFSVSHGKSEGGSLKEEYPVSLWVVVDKDDERPTIIRYSRRGFLTGNIKLGDREHSVVVSDRNNHGVSVVSDWCGKRLLGETKGEINRAIGDYAWAVVKAWK